MTAQDFGGLAAGMPGSNSDPVTAVAVASTNMIHYYTTSGALVASQTFFTPQQTAPAWSSGGNSEAGGI